MGLKLNGNTLVIVAALVLIALIGCTTVIVVAGGLVPGFFSEIALALTTALGAGAVVNHVNTHPPDPPATGK